MQPTTHAFKENARKALKDDQLRSNLLNVRHGFQDKRAATVAKLPEFEALREAGRDIKNHTIENLDFYLERFEQKVLGAGGHVHWARNGAEAREAVLNICRSVNAKTVTKGKSMIAEEIGLNDFLEKQGIEPIETDLGEYIIQLRGEAPSHIIAPAIHVNKEQVADAFRKAHTELPADRNLTEPRDLTDEARQMLRQDFINADVGITGANLLIAETGSTVIVTNEGNGDLTQSLPRIHVVVTSIEKVVPTLEDASTILRLLARSATGQEYSSYTTFSTGPRRPGDLDGPDEYHVVLLDNGRSKLLGTPAQDVLRCIRCAACMNHCPVYSSVGGHAYGWVVPGPIGAALDPALIGIEEAGDLPNASTFCGRCAEVCPMKIPLPKIMHHWREVQFDSRLTPPVARLGLKFWAFFAARPGLYHFANRFAMAALSWAGRSKGRLSRVPLAGGWTRFRDLPAPEGRTFQAQWAQRNGPTG